MRKIGLFNIGKLGLAKSAGTGKTDINKVIEKWIPKHMVFWYDMSKPVDTYSQNFNDWRSHPSVNADVIITSTSFVITRFATLNDTVKCYIPDQTKNFPGMKVEVKGIVDGQELYWGDSANVKLVNITQDGTYDIPPLGTVNGNLSFRNGNIVGACNITITQLPSGQSVPTNEILKANPYLQDHSGNNRPLKLNNFLFAAMSGVGGYEMNYTDSALFITYLSGVRGDGTITDNTITINNVKVSNGVIETRVSSPSKKYKVRVTGITSNETLRYVVYGDTSLGELAMITFDMKKDGEYELPASTYSATYNMKWQVIAASYPHTCNITIEQIPSYPNALVTDGVDDYGVVENFDALQNYMMFFQCAIICPNTSKGMFSTKSINNNQGWMLCQNHGKDITRFGNNTYMNFESSTNVEDKTNYILTADGTTMVLRVGDELQPLNGTYSGTGGEMGFFISNYNHTSRFGSMAFYKSILFNAVPTKETDGFTEQDLIDYYIPKAIVTITVVDVSGSPIQDATVTVGGVQYKTLSDGTVKVRGMVNGTMSLSVKKDGYMPFSDNSWKLADSRITLEVLRNTVITENGYSILLEHDGLILTE